MGSPMTLSYLTLSHLERSKSRSLIFQSIISRKGAELGHMLFLNINRKACMGSPLAQLHLTLVTLEGQCQGHSDFEGLYLVNMVKEAELGHALLLDINRKACMGSPLVRLP